MFSHRSREIAPCMEFPDNLHNGFFVFSNFRAFVVNVLFGCSLRALRETDSESEFQGEADVALFGGEEIQVHGIRQCLKEVVLEFPVVFVG